MPDDSNVMNVSRTLTLSRGQQPKSRESTRAIRHPLRRWVSHIFKNPVPQTVPQICSSCMSYTYFGSLHVLVRSHPQPRVINTDLAPIYSSAIPDTKKEGTLCTRCRHRPVQ